MSLRIRKQILQYFNDAHANCEPRPQCCDACARVLAATPATAAVAAALYADMNAAGQYDFGPDARLLLAAVELFQGRSGLTKPINVLRGSNAAATQSYVGHALHGRGRHRAEAYWKQLCELLDCERLTRRERSAPSAPGAFPFVVVRLTGEGERWLQRPAAAMWLRPPVPMLAFLRKTATAAGQPAAAAATSANGLTGRRLPVSSDRQKLAASLMLCRSALATRHDVMPYMVASNRALEQLGAVRPLDVEALRAANVDGFSEAKLLQFGGAFVECIVRLVI